VKILYVLSTSTLYGTSKSLLFLLKSLNQKEYNPVVVLNSKGPLVDEIEKLRVPVKRIPLKRWIIPKRQFFMVIPRLVPQLCNIIKLYFYIKRENIDIVHSFDSVAIEGAIAAKIAGVPHVWRIAEIYESNPELCPVLGNSFTRKIIEILSDVVTPVSKGVGGYFRDYARNKKIVVVHNAIDVTAFRTDKKEDPLRREYCIDKKAKIVGTIGSLDPRKGFDDFVKAAARVIKIHPGNRYVIVGNGNYKYLDILKKLAGKFNVEEAFIFTGFKNDVQRFIPSFDIFVMSSWEEPFSRVVLEAMACAKPVIGTNTGGNPEIILQNETGVLIPPKYPDAMAKAIAFLLDNPQKAKEMGEAGYNRVRDYFNTEKQIREMSSIYKKVLKR